MIAKSGGVAGKEVKVDLVMLKQPGYIVIRTESEEALGKVWLAAGKHRDVKIDLGRVVVQGEKLYAVLYNDNGETISRTQF